VAAAEPEEDAADVRLLQRRGRAKAKAGNAMAKDVMQSWADAEWFTSRPEVAEDDHRHRVQGARRDQHRRPVARAGRLEPPGHPAALPGDAEEHPPRRGLQARGRRQARPDAVHRGPEEEGPPGRLRGRRGRYRFFAQVRHQQRDLGHRSGHPVRAEQAFWRRDPGRQDRPHLFQHAGRLRLVADRSGRVQAGNGRRDRRAALRRQAGQERRR
jgi:hypothetical protein